MVDIHSTQSIADPSPLNLFPIFGRGDSDIKIKVPLRPSNKIVKDHQPANGPKRVSLPMTTKTARELENNKYLNVKEAAIYVNIPENTIRSKWIAMRKVPYHKIGKSIMFKRVELDEWMDQQKIEPITIN